MPVIDSISVLNFGLALLLIALVPAVLLAASYWILRRLDDRGMFEVPPFSWLPWAAGSILTFWMLCANEFMPALTTQGLWFSDFWALPALDAYRLWLSPVALLNAWAQGIHEFWTITRAPTMGFWIFLGLVLTAFIVAFLAWRSKQAWRGIACFGWLLFVAATTLYMLVILTAWLVHWLNFWVLLIIFAVLYHLSTRKTQGSSRQAL